MQDQFFTHEFIPAGGGRLTPISYGNPGKDLGLRSATFKVGNWVGTGNFHVIEATDGTWLSSATRKFGWGAAYGPKDGYGAYIEGVVRRSDGTPIFGSDADSINPGEHYYIAIYQGGGDGAKSRKEKLELTSGEKERIEIQGPTVGMAEAIGISKELLGQLVEPLGLVFAFLEIPMHMIDLGRGPHPPMAVARAHCYAKTAFAWMEEESGPPPTSSVFDFLKYNKLVRYQDLYPIVQKAWRDSWIETVEQLTRQFDEARIKIYMEVSSRGGNTRPLNVKSLRRLAKSSLQQEHGSAAEYCRHCLNDVGKANWWKNYFPPNIKPLWDLQTKTPYPD